jgi:hypothetical protein
MFDSREYEDRYCAFVDILGFRQLVRQLDDDLAKFDELKAVLKKVHTHPSGGGDDQFEAEVRSQSISDAVALSTDVTAAGLAGLFATIRTLSIDLLCQGFFLRGAIVRGRLFHNSQMIFGAALVRAYDFESTVAKFPRVVVTREVRDDMLKFLSGVDGGENYPKAEELRQSTDGPIYLHVLEPVVAVLRRGPSVYSKATSTAVDDYSKYRAIRDKIQEKYEESMDNPSHFEKVRWFADYWNEVVPDNLFLSVRGAGLGPKLGGR